MLPRVRRQNLLLITSHKTWPQPIPPDQESIRLQHTTSLVQHHSLGGPVEIRILLVAGGTWMVQTTSASLITIPKSLMILTFRSRALSADCWPKFVSCSPSTQITISANVWSARMDSLSSLRRWGKGKVFPSSCFRMSHNQNAADSLNCHLLASDCPPPWQQASGSCQFQHTPG